MTESTGIAPNGNGSKNGKESALTKLLAQCKDVKVNDTDRKKATEAFKKAMGKRAELEKALKDFDATADATAVAMVRCFGGKHVMVDGVRFVPTSRGERVYYKRMGNEQDVVEL